MRKKEHACVCTQTHKHTHNLTYDPSMVMHTYDPVLRRQRQED